MGIRARISAGTNLVEDNGDDNVSNPRSTDERGVVNPQSDVIGGSYINALCGPDATAEEIRGTMKALAAGVSEDGKQLHPNDLHVQNLLANVRIMDNPGFNVEYTYRQRLRSPLTAIRAFAVLMCHSGSPKAASECTNMSCPLWPFRMGKNGLR